MELAKPGSAGSPVALYALYVQKGLTARAKALRARATAEASYDISSQFDSAAANPEAYLAR